MISVLCQYVPIDKKPERIDRMETYLLLLSEVLKTSGCSGAARSWGSRSDRSRWTENYFIKIQNLELAKLRVFMFQVQKTKQSQIGF